MSKASTEARREEKVKVTVVFTKFDNLINDIKNKLRCSEGWTNQDFLEKSDHLLARANFIVNTYVHNLQTSMPSNVQLDFFFYALSTKHTYYTIEDEQIRLFYSVSPLQSSALTGSLTPLTDLTALKQHIATYATTLANRLSLILSAKVTVPKLKVIYKERLESMMEWRLIQKTAMGINKEIHRFQETTKKKAKEIVTAQLEGYFIPFIQIKVNKFIDTKKGHYGTANKFVSALSEHTSEELRRWLQNLERKVL